jgi:hypothetical protein
VSVSVSLRYQIWKAAESLERAAKNRHCERSEATQKIGKPLDRHAGLGPPSDVGDGFFGRIRLR